MPDARIGSGMISVVVPCYRTSGTLRELCSRLRAVFGSRSLEYEIVLVDDRSPEPDWSAILECAAADPRVRGIRLSRNFGQHAAITAGIDAARGDWVVVMDGDLQDVPENIPAFLDKAGEGWDVVRARRRNRRDSPVKVAWSRLYHAVFSSMTGSVTDPAIASFGVYRRKVIDAFLLHRERYRGFRTFIDYMGFEKTAIEVDHARREVGTTSYTFRKGLRLAMDNLFAFSDRPLKAIVKMGLAMSLVSSAYWIYLFLRALFGGRAVEGWASIMVSIWFVGSLNVLLLGTIGLYIGRIFDQVKNRPLYIVDERTNNM